MSIELLSVEYNKENKFFWLEILGVYFTNDGRSLFHLSRGAGKWNFEFLFIKFI